MLQLANINRIHIIGCARSGTTMLHYSMVAFKNTILYDNETEIWNTPNLSNTVKLFAKHIIRKETYFYVTKRSYEWWHDEQIEYLSSHAPKENIFIINVVRDPRDVLTSKHVLSDRTYYVEPERWLSSINAADKLFSNLDDYENKLTLRYEDIVCKPDEIRIILEDKIGMDISPNVKDWSRLKDNLQKDTSKNMIAYMHVLRNFDPNSIGRWSQDERKIEYINDLLLRNDFGKKLKNMMTRYNYNF